MDFKEKLKKFLEKKSNLKKMIVIYWPTASGKTGMSIEVAKMVDSEILSTDSRQIFKGMDIWTGKITEDEKDWIPHHMLDIITPDMEYSVWEYKELAEQKIEEIYAKWNIPILCGGTWLYIDSLIYDFNIPRIPADLNIRKSLEEDLSVRQMRDWLRQHRRGYGGPLQDRGDWWPGVWNPVDAGP